jgi:hypothetical protein
MICEMTILPSGKSRNHVRHHLVSLRPISYTQCQADTFTDKQDTLDAGHTNQ